MIPFALSVSVALLTKDNQKAGTDENQPAWVPFRSRLSDGFEPVFELRLRCPKRAQERKFKRDFNDIERFGAQSEHRDY